MNTKSVMRPHKSIPTLHDQCRHASLQNQQKKKREGGGDEEKQGEGKRGEGYVDIILCGGAG